MDTLVAIGVLMIVFGVFADLALVSHNAGNRLYAKQKCTAAALAQLDSITHNRSLIPEDCVKSLWEGVTVEATVSAGSGDFEGLFCYMAKAVYDFGEVQFSSEQTRYLPYDCLSADIK